MRASFREWQPVDLTAKQQQLLAMWMTKIAMLLVVRQHDLAAEHAPLAGEHVPEIPPLHFAAVRKTKDRPPKGTRVWISCIPLDEKMPVFAHAAGSIEHPEVDGDGSPTGRRIPHGYFSLLAVGPVILYLSASGLDDDARRGFTHRNEMGADLAVSTGLFRRIWPIAQQVVHWPTPKRFGADAWEEFAMAPAQWRDKINHPLSPIRPRAEPG